MAKKSPIYRKLYRMTLNFEGINQKTLRLRKSLDEVKKQLARIGGIQEK